jgi:predicted XRE-type DNA-binding protein
MAQVPASSRQTPHLRGTRAGRAASRGTFPRSRREPDEQRELVCRDDRPASPKHLLASQVNRLLGEQKLSQLAAAERLGISQSKVSAIRNYKLHGISLGRLMQALVALDQRVTIVVRPWAAPPKESISVVQVDFRSTT